MTLVQQPDHVGEALTLILEQFKDKEKYKAFLSSFVTQVQALETAFFELYLLRSIDSALGAQLDGLGQTLSVPRSGLADEPYRTRLRVAIRAGESSGTVEDIIEIVDLSAAVPVTIRIQQSSPADFSLDIFEPIANGSFIALLVRRAKAAGVYGYTTWLDNSTFAGPWFGFVGAPGAAGFGVGGFGTAA